jgi:chemotaxis signal transduction protein
LSDIAPVVNKAAEMRMAFDQTYAVAPASQAVEPIEDLLAIRLGGHPYALRTTEVSAFVRSPKVVALPSLILELEGVAGIRGGIVPVYSLSALLGCGREEQQRWCVLCGSEEPVAFAFSDFEGYIRAGRSQIYAASQDDLTGELVQQVIRTPEIIRPIVSLPAVAEMIKKRCSRELTPREKK